MKSGDIQQKTKKLDALFIWNKVPVWSWNLDTRICNKLPKGIWLHHKVSGLSRVEKWGLIKWNWEQLIFHLIKDSRGCILPTIIPIYKVKKGKLWEIF